MMTTKETPAETPHPAEQRTLTAAERRPVSREPIAEYKRRVRADDQRTTEERRAILADQVARLVASGHRLEYQGSFDAVLVRSRRFRGDQRVLVAVNESGVCTVEDQ